jgi:hypothetical protein
VKDVSASHDTGGVGDAERHYISSNCDVKVLLVLCRGIFEPDGSPLLDENAEPWRSVKPRLSIKPTAKDLRAEVTRRFQSFICNGSDKTRAPQPKQWTTDKLEEYLKNHPITKETDVQFLRRKVLEHKLIVEEAQLSSQCNNDLLQKEWYGKIPVLRLIHAIVEDDRTKRAFLTRFDLDNNRTAVDNRNSIDKRSTTVWELVSNRWNDPDFNPHTEILTAIHSDYSVEINIGFESVADLLRASPEKCVSVSS